MSDHALTLVFRDAEAGDLGRCDCGAQGFDYNDGRDWFAEHMGLGTRERKTELYRRQAERAAADIATWPEWMRNNLTPPRRTILR